ncbi:UPF0261 domain protein [Aspergillus sp. HF37]|nr:UPF0261 domain protein [Aspergillus sp. HF37]
MPTILLLATCDTKLPEALYVHSRLHNHNVSVLLLDLSRSPVSHPLITLAAAAPRDSLAHLTRADYITETISRATPLVRSLHQTNRIHAVLGLGGSCGSALATGVMRAALPVGFPKVMVSTMASGDVRPYVGEADIAMLYSVVDIAGRNAVLDRVLGNAAGMAAGAAGCYAAAAEEEGQGGNLKEKGRRTRVGVSMFGLTTPCVTTLSDYLTNTHDYEVYVFHATGAGGRAMERLVADGQLDAVVDMTTTEVADEVAGGVLSAGPQRLEAAARAGIPCLVSVGACDMANFGPFDEVPAMFKGRLLHPHNPSVTLMRTSVDECSRIARFIASKLRASARPDLVRVVLPTGGVSAIDLPGLPFHAPDADSVLFSTLENELEGSGIPVLRDHRHINDPEFAVSAAKSIVELIQRHST